MELKRVIGKDSRHAMEEVVRLYGPDALVVSSHKVNRKFEMVVAVDVEEDAELIDLPDDELVADDNYESKHQADFKAILHGDVAASSAKTEEYEALRANEIVQLFRDEIQVLKREVRETRNASAWHMQVANPQGLTKWQQGLMDHGIPSRLKTLLIDSIAGITDHDEAEAQLLAVLSESLRSATELPEEISGIHAFCGPTGSGKTTVIGKLARIAAEQFGGEKIAIISFKDNKIGAWSQLQLMAGQWGGDCFRAQSTEALETILREVSDYSCVLIDTSGIGIETNMQELMQYAPESLIHLVLHSEISESSANRLFNNRLPWDSVNVTKLDESTDSWVLLDAILQNPGMQIWLGSASDQLTKPVTLMDITKWVVAILSTVEMRPLRVHDLDEPKDESRQTSDRVSTLDLLTGLRASKYDRVIDRA